MSQHLDKKLHRFRANQKQPLGLSKQVIVYQSFVRLRMLCNHTTCLNFKARVVLLQTARVWGTTDTLQI